MSEELNSAQKRIVEDGEDVAMEFYQCSNCANKYFDGDGCPAYPDGIPYEVLLNDVIHDRVLEGQTGETIFEAEDEELD